MVIRIVDLVPGADTGHQGAIVFAHLRDALKNGQKVAIAFTGVQTATSSFVNSAFVPLLNEISLSQIKANLRILDSTRQINEMIKSRLERHALVAA